MSASETEPEVETIEFGLWWPSAEPDELRSAAAAWQEMAEALDACALALASPVADVTRSNTGAAVEAFASYMDRWTNAHLPQAAAHCRDMAAAFDEYADAVEEVRDQIRQMAIEIAATIAVGVGLAWLTAGVSAGAAAGITAAMVARAGLLATSLAARAIAVSSRIVVFAGLGAVEGGAANLVVQTGRNVFTSPNRDPFAGYDTDELAWSFAGGAVGGAALGGLRSVPLLRGVEPPVDSSRLPFGVTGYPRAGSALKLDRHHGFPGLVDNFSAGARRTLIPRRGPGGVVQGQDELLQRAGSLDGVDGVFEWIVRNGEVVHRRFIPRGVVSGVPNQVPPPR